MPKNKAGVDNKFLKSIEGEYGEFGVGIQNNYIDLNYMTQLQNTNKELHEGYREALEDYNDSAYEIKTYGEDPLYPLREFPGTITLRYKGGNYEALQKIRKLEAEAKSVFDELKNQEDARNYEDYFALLGLEFNYEPGEYADAYMNSMFLSQLVDVIGSGPKFFLDFGKVQRSLKEVEEALRKPDGSGFFVPYMALCKSVKTLWDIEVEKVRIGRLGWTPEVEKEFSRKYKAAFQSFMDKFDTLKKVIMDNPGLYDDWLDNQPEHMVDYDRDHNKEYGQFKGQIKAIDNGWGVDELEVLGVVEEVSHLLPIMTKRKKLSEKLAEAEQKLADLRKEADQLPNDIAELKQRRDSDAGIIQARIAAYDEEYKELIDRYKVYEDKLKAFENDKTLDAKKKKEEISKLKQDNKALLDEYKEYLDVREKLDYDKIISDKEKRLANLPDEINKTEVSITNIRKTEEGLQKLKEETDKLKEKIYDKKVETIADKREVLSEVKAYFERTKDLTTNPDPYTTFNKYIKNNFNKVIDKIDKSYSSGITKDIEGNKLASERTEFILDIYGPNPKHHEVWEERKVISKTQMDDAIKPYDTDGLPFSTKEMAFLGMAGTISAKDEIIAANKGEGRDFDDVLSTSSTRWLEDVCVNTEGPRENFAQFRYIVAKGRENARQAMQSYVQGDAALLCAIIHDGMANISAGSDKLTTFDDISVYQYGMLSTLTNLLRKDSKLLQEFNRYNESLSPEKRVDIDKIYSIRNYAKMRMDGRDAENKLAALEKEIAGNLKKKPDFYDEQQKNRDEVTLALYERSARKGRIISRMFNAANKILSASPEMYERNMQYVNDSVQAQKNGQPLIAVEDAQNRYFREHVRLNPAFVFLGTKDGKAALDEFADMLSDKYGAKYKADERKLVTDKGSFENDPKYTAELNKFIFELANKQILKELSTGDIGKDRMRELAKDYMINNYRINLCNNQIESGVVEPFADFETRSVAANINMHKSFEDSVKAFVQNMDMSDINSHEFAKVLSGGREQLADTAKNLELLIQEKAWADPKARAGLNLPALDEALNALEEADKGVLFGSKEYKNILNDFRKLNEDIKINEANFKKNEGFTYDGRGLAKREQDLINRLNTYIERKESELNAQPENRKNQTSLTRRDSAKDAVKALTNRLKKEAKAPTITENGREDAQILREYVELSKNEDFQIIDRGVIEKPSGLEMLKDTIDEADYQRIKYATMLNANNKDDINSRSITDAYIETVKDALYTELLRTAFTPKPNDSEAVKAENDVKLKVTLKKGNNTSIRKMIDGVMNTKYGKRLAKELIDDAVNPSLKPEDYKGAMNHDSIISVRDHVFVTCFNEEMEKYAVYLKEADKQLDKMYTEKNRTADIKLKLKEIDAMEKNIYNLVSLAGNIGSKALDKPSEKYIEMKQARIDRNNAREKAKNERKAKHATNKNKTNNINNNVNNNNNNVHKKTANNNPVKSGFKK